MISIHSLLSWTESNLYLTITRPVATYSSGDNIVFPAGMDYAMNGLIDTFSNVGGFWRNNVMTKTNLSIASVQLIVLNLALWANSNIYAATVGQDDWGAPKVQVLQEKARWTVEGSKNRIELKISNLQMTVHTQKRTWSMIPSFSGDLIVEKSGQPLSLRLADAKRKTIKPYHTGFKSGLKVTLAGFTHKGKEVDVRIVLFLCLEGQEEELVCELIATEKTTTVLECFWPQAIANECYDDTVIPFMQGMLLPKGWPKKVWLYNTMSYGRGLYMPWWGHQKGASAMLVLIETPDDAGCRFEHPAGGPTKMELRWVHSLGRFAYPRRVRLCFFDEGNYVTMAKRYRRYVRQTGHFVSLKEKITRTPLVGKLVGSPVIHTSILYHIQPESSYYHKDEPEKNHRLVTFDRRAEQLRQLAQKGIGRAYVHLDGWGFRGYDNLHPDIIPPCPEAGGWEGMKRLAETCAQLGYVFAIHDQYRD